MRSSALFAAAGLALTACARSEPAGEPVDPSNLPEAAPPIPTGPVIAPAESEDGRLADALRMAVADAGGLGDEARWLTARSDLDGDGRDEALVYLIDPLKCGTGGCSLFLFADDGQGNWQLVDKVAVTRAPIYRLQTSSNGWADLGITIEGGGGKSMLVKLSRETDGYPENPTVPPGAEANSEGAMLLIDEGEGTPIPKGGDNSAPPPGSTPSVEREAEPN